MDNSQSDLPFSSNDSESRIPIYTMPEKFLPVKAAKKTKAGKGIIVFLYMLIAVVLLGGGLAFWYFFVYSSQSPAADETPTVEFSGSPSPASDEQTEAADQLTAIELKFVAKDQVTREEVGSLLVKLNGQDSPVADLIQVSSLLPYQASGRARQAVGAIYTIASTGGSLSFKKPTTFIFSYIEPQDLTTKKENSLRLFEEKGADNWVELSGTALDIIGNEISIVWQSLPTGRITILSNLEEELIASEPETETTDEELLQTVNPLSISVDSDNDQLSDQEELLYQSNKDLPDTDNDGYLDGSEVINGYSPVSTANLLADDLVKEYENSQLGFKVYYPYSWLAVPAGEGGGQLVVFESLQDDFIQISLADNPAGMTARAWYQNLVPNFNSAELAGMVVDGYEGVISPDLGNFYLAVNDKILIFTYSSGLKIEVDYLTTFRMIYQSFKKISL